MIQNLTVVGAGNMGHQIAMCAAINGFYVTITDVSGEALARMAAFTESYLNGRVEKGRLNREQADEAAARIQIVSDFDEAVRRADLVIEAVVEKLDVKRELFARLSAACPTHTILATNSSYIVSSELACVTERPSQVCNMHFFAPALVMKLVEIVRGPHTSQETVDAIYETSERMGKIPVVVNREIDGFIVNRLFEPLLFEAHRLADLGIASPEDIDKAAKYGLGHPMGPFEVNDMSGLDLTYTIMSERYRKSGNPAERPGLLLSQHYFAHEYGKKTGKGFYEYGSDGKKLEK